MSFVIIIGLLVAVVSLLWIFKQQSKTIKNYEKELIRKARKGSNVSKK